MGPLSDVLSLLKPRRYSSGGMDRGGDWSVLFPAIKGSSATQWSPVNAGWLLKA